jgi:hypothetical protein
VISSRKIIDETIEMQLHKHERMTGSVPVLTRAGDNNTIEIRELSTPLSLIRTTALIIQCPQEIREFRRKGIKTGSNLLVLVRMVNHTTTVKPVT